MKHTLPTWFSSRCLFRNTAVWLLYLARYWSQSPGTAVLSKPGDGALVLGSGSTLLSSTCRAARQKWLSTAQRLHACVRWTALPRNEGAAGVAWGRAALQCCGVALTILFLNLAPRPGTNATWIGPFSFFAVRISTLPQSWSSSLAVRFPD